MLAATTPWRMVVATFRGVGRAFAWLPFMRVAWTLRGVVGVICVVQSVTEGRTWPGTPGGAVIVLTYLVPAAGRVSRPTRRPRPTSWWSTSGWARCWLACSGATGIR